MSTQYQQVVNTFSALGDDAFVQKGYLTLLGRPADPTGLRDYVARLRAGVPRVQVWGEWATSDEAKRFAVRQAAKPVAPAVKTAPVGSSAPVASLMELLAFDGAEFVRQAYRCVLGREADPSGLSGYVQRLEAGTSRSQLVADLRCDPEGKAFDSKLPGLDDWVKLVQHKASFSEVLTWQGRMFVVAAYVALFEREPDPAGFARYMELLRSGASRSFLLMELARSPEAREKASDIRGLENAIAVYRKAQRKSWTGWYCRNVLGAESDLPADRERRALAYAAAGTVGT